MVLSGHFANFLTQMLLSNCVMNTPARQTYKLVLLFTSPHPVFHPVLTVCMRSIRIWLTPEGIIRAEAANLAPQHEYKHGNELKNGALVYEASQLDIH